MRKAGLIFIAVLGLLALFVDVAPNLRVPELGPEGGTRRLETKLGLDLQGGLAVEYRVNPVGDERPNAAALAVIRDIIERRVNSTGVAEPVVQTQGTDRIVVELPGVQDTQTVRRLVGQTGELNFVPIPPGEPIPPVGTAIDLARYPPLFRGDELSSASIGQDQNGGRSVDFVLKDNGSKLFEEYTREHIQDYFAIVLDGVVISAPQIQDAITGGRVQITQGSTIGGYPLREAQELVNVLQFGSLPFPIEELSSDTISPTLGAEFVDKSITAGLIGIGLVLLFMLIHYRMPGAVAGGALIYYAVLVFAVFRLIPVTLTLAGIAGFVLSVGMAVDANILIFERTKEELRLGKSLPAAIEAGFGRAWNSILDSNVSSLITASILYFFGSSVIQGFALVLIIGVLISMFTAITVTRQVLRVLVDHDWARKAGLYGVASEDFIAWPTSRTARRDARRV
ncbi:MAG: protein translocase subunit SecD [Chloroflexota bacterium]